MGEVLQFTCRRRFFDPDDTAAMGEAYDRAMATIYPDETSAFVVGELIAKRIIRMARTGEIDCERLSRLSVR